MNSIIIHFQLKNFLLVLVIYVTCLMNTFAQSNLDKYRKLEVNGTAFNKNVNSLFEDSIGFLWIGTKSGLYRYDGNELVLFQNDAFDPNSLPNNNINSIVEDNFGNLWLGSETWLILYNSSEDKFYKYYQGRSSKVLKKDSKGNIWVATKQVGLTKIKPNEKVDQTSFDSSFKYLDDTINIEVNIDNFDLIEDQFGRYWIGTASGLIVLSDEGALQKTGFNSPVKSLKVLKNNKLLALSDNGINVLGFNKSSIDLEVLETYASNTFNNVSIRSMTKDTLTDVLWVGSNNGLYKGIRHNNLYHFNHLANDSETSVLLNDQISSTLLDSFGNLWIGTWKGLIKYVNKPPIMQLNTIQPNITDNSVVNSLLTIDENTLLVTRQDGMFSYNLNENTFHKIKTDIEKIDRVTHNFTKNKLLLYNSNILYEATHNSTDIDALELKEIEKFDNYISALIPINNNEMWVGVWGEGIKIINDQTEISSFRKKIISMFKNSHVSTMNLSRHSGLWIGTRGEGLYRIDLNKETIENFNPETGAGISSDAILCLYEDEENNIWIGTRGGGLNKYDVNTKTFKIYSKKDGLNSNIISAIEADASGNLWLHTEEGINRLTIENEEIISFGAEDGFEQPIYTFNVSASSKDKQTLFFGSIDGFYSVFPDKYVQREILPSVAITRFQILNAAEISSNITTDEASKQKINPASNQKIELPYDQSNILISFSSLDLTAPNKNKYAYKLEGLNDYWIYTDASNRNANYNNLPPGKYTFKVKGTNSDGVWNEEPVIIQFTILPPIWATTWAYTAYFLLVCLILFLSILLMRRWYKLKKNLVEETVSRKKDNEHHKMKTTFFTDISHELRTPLSLILGTIEKVVKNDDLKLSATSSQRIYNNTLRMNRLINQIMDLRKFEEGKLRLNISENDIIADMKIIKKAFNDFAKSRKINYKFNCDLNHFDGWYDVDILEKILFNLLSNSFKYTPDEGEIILKSDIISITDETDKNNKLKKGTYLKCSVIDNGLGIPKTDLPFIFDRFYQSTKAIKNQISGTGIGMELVQKLVERHYGFIEVDSIENKFTEFTFYLPINKEMFDLIELSAKRTPLKKNYIRNSEYQVIESKSPEKKDSKPSKKLSKPKILLVEDNQELRNMLAEDLQADFEILEASNGLEGFEICVDKKPDLVISDILMPIEDGVSMLQRIKANDSVKSIPVFMLTAKNSDEDKIRCLQFGAEDHIEKPFSLEFLKWKLKNNLSHRKELKEKYSKVITAAPADIEVDSNDDKFISRLVSIIEEFMDDNLLSVEFLASEAGMSRTHLYRKVQSILNDTPVNFIKKIRLKRAAQLLEKNSMYISEVAYMTGFNSQKYFGKCFAKEYGMSPTEYMKKHANTKEDEEISLKEDSN